MHPQIKKLLEELNSKKPGKIVPAAALERHRAEGLKRGEVSKSSEKLSRAELEGRGGPL